MDQFLNTALNPQYILPLLGALVAGGWIGHKQAAARTAASSSSTLWTPRTRRCSSVGRGTGTGWP